VTDPDKRESCCTPLRDVSRGKLGKPVQTRMVLSVVLGQRNRRPAARFEDERDDSKTESSSGRTFLFGRTRFTFESRSKCTQYTATQRFQTFVFAWYGWSEGLLRSQIRVHCRRVVRCENSARNHVAFFAIVITLETVDRTKPERRLAARRSNRLKKKFTAPSKSRWNVRRVRVARFNISSAILETCRPFLILLPFETSQRNPNSDVWFWSISIYSDESRARPRKYRSYFINIFNTFRNINSNLV